MAPSVIESLQAAIAASQRYDADAFAPLHAALARAARIAKEAAEGAAAPSQPSQPAAAATAAAATAEAAAEEGEGRREQVPSEIDLVGEEESSTEAPCPKTPSQDLFYVSSQAPGRGHGGTSSCSGPRSCAPQTRLWCEKNTQRMLPPPQHTCPQLLPSTASPDARASRRECPVCFLRGLQAECMRAASNASILLWFLAPGCV